mmetsp:Transcript_42341/g.76832  ORF Transcript_42341/g.76832 Transcript_42341/m.76832 type:complete len:1103 (-) Transcript_42341:113-3421(-)
MQTVLRTLRQLTAGVGDEGSVYRAGAAVQATAPSRPRNPADTVRLQLVNDEDEVELDEQGVQELGHESAVEVSEFEVVAELHTWGKAANYQLGFAALGEAQPVPRHVPFTGSLQVEALSCGRFHTVAVASTGAVFTWGFGGTTSRLGIETLQGGSVACLVEPTQLPEFGQGRAVACKASVGMNHSLILTTCGKVYGWGSNAHGQVGAQGVPCGEGAQVRRPTLVKAALRSEHIADIAAGAEHSLCVSEGGHVFSWGCNANGELGLGLAPQGPTEASAPRAVVQLKAAHAVIASSSSPLSAALVAHGDPVIWGAAPTQDPKGQAGGSTSSSRGGSTSKAGGPTLPADSRLYVPTRVRRREGKVSGDSRLQGANGASNRLKSNGGEEANDGEDWQFQRGTAGSAAAPIRSLVLTADYAFAADADGFLWTWSCRAQRPCFAEPLYITAAKSQCDDEMVPPLSQLAGPDRLGGVWAISGQASQNLWRLEQDGEGWTAERYPRLAQVSHLECSGEHQAAIVTYRRPHKKDTGSKREAAQPSSLQHLCEERLIQSIGPRNLGLVCQVAWELRRPELLDAAYAFFRANMYLMGCDQFLPSLAQMPEEVLIAFEMALDGALSQPSEALEANPWEWPPQEWRIDPDSCVINEVSEPTLPRDQAQRRRRPDRQAGKAGGNAGDKAASPVVGSIPSKTVNAASPQGVATAKPPPVTRSPNQQVAALPSATLDPCALPGSLLRRQAEKLANFASEDWIEVRAVKRKSGQSVPGGQSSTPLAASPAMGPTRPSGKASPEVVPSGPASGPGSGPGTPSMRPAPLSLGDFLVPKSASRQAVSNAAASSPPSKAQPGPTAPSPTVSIAPSPSIGVSSPKINTAPHHLPQTVIAMTPPLAPQPRPAQGPSQMLSAALRSAQEFAEAPATWAAPEEKYEALSFRQILQEEEGCSQGSKPTAEDASTERTRNSWGLDVMPSMQPKRDSVYDIQQQEVVEKARQKENEEIQEIEALFAALEVAELAEEREALGLPNPDALPSDKGRHRKGRSKGGRKGGTAKKHDRHSSEGGGGEQYTKSGSWTSTNGSYSEGWHHDGWKDWNGGRSSRWQDARWSAKAEGG